MLHRSRRIAGGGGGVKFRANGNMVARVETSASATNFLAAGGTGCAAAGAPGLPPEFSVKNAGAICCQQAARARRNSS